MALGAGAARGATWKTLPNAWTAFGQNPGFQASRGAGCRGGDSVVVFFGVA